MIAFELNYKNILIPIDFSDNSKAALEYAINFSKIFSSKLFLIYVIEPLIYPSDFGLSQIPIAPINFEIQRKAEEELTKIAKQFTDTNIEFEIIVKTGKPYLEIINAAKENKCDLIIISTHGHSSIEQILFGSTVEKVVKKSNIPVLIIRRKENNNRQKL